MEEQLAGLVGEALGIGGGVVRIGYYVARFTISALKKRGGGPAPTGEQFAAAVEGLVNYRIEHGDFAGAEEVLRSFGVPSDGAREAVKQLRAANHINSFLRKGQFAEAEAWVQSSYCVLPRELEEDLLRQIQDLSERHAERQRQAEEWTRELSRLLAQGEVRKARKYVSSLPVPEAAKKELLSRLPKPAWFG